VDPRIKALVMDRLNGRTAKEGLADIQQNPLWQNAEKRIPIKSVKVFALATQLPALRTKPNGDPKDFVSLSNNHHVALYEDPATGKRSETVVSQMEAVHRKKQGLSPIDRNPTDGRRFLFSMQINEMFLIGLDPELVDVNDPANAAEVSRCLYRVQKLSSVYYVFRHHLATQVTDDRQMVRIVSFPRTEDLYKVRIDITGKLLPCD
jgi:CRISPR-associated endonuclease Csn1